MFEWITRPTLGNAMILSDDWDIFEQQNTRAMVSLNSSTTDSLTSWVQFHAVGLYNRLVGRLIHVSLAPSPLTRIPWGLHPISD